MKKYLIILILFVLAGAVRSQLVSYIMHGDTVFYYNPSTRDSMAVNKPVLKTVNNTSIWGSGNISAGGNPDSLVFATRAWRQKGNDSLGSILSTKSSLAGSEVLTNKTLGSFNYAVDAQSNDSYVITLSPAPLSYTTGMMIVFKANTQNTTACSINVNGLGVKNIVKRVSATPATGDILAGMLCWIVYDGTNFVLLNPIVN